MGRIEMLDDRKEQQVNGRERALRLLTQARDIVADRLTERVLELQGELLDDARGDSYGGEIEALFDQFGSKLNQLNTLLSCLPSRVESQQSAPLFAVPAAPTSSIMVTADSDKIESAADSDSGSNDVPAGAVPLEPTLGFQVFVRQTLRRDIEAAGCTLALLFGIAGDRAEQCARHFRDQLDQDPGFLTRAKALRSQIAQGETNDALLSLWECFGLQGPESLLVMRALQARLM